jgi:hypothetical protein
MIPVAEIVEGKALLETVVYSLATAIGVMIAFSSAIYGATRAVELRRDERLIAAGAAAILMAVGLAVCAAALVLGFVVMTSK